MQTIPMVEARKKLTSLPEELETQGKDPTVVVTRRGKPVLAIMSWEFFEALYETIEIMGDEELMKSLRQSIKEAREGKTIPWERAKKELQA
jgi:prevent-host-death family protein